MRPARALAVVTMTAATLSILAAPGRAQSPAQSPPAQGRASPAPALAPPKPYKPVPVSLPAPAKDPSFDAFRQQLGDIAKRKDRGALAKLVVAQGFFWETEQGDKADKKKSGIDNLSTVLDLNAADSPGWDALAAAAQEPTLEPVSERKGVSCSPATPAFDEQAFEALLKATGTDPSEWAFPTVANLEIRAAPQPTAAVVEKLGMNFVRALPEEPPANQAAPDAPPFVKVVAPDGKTGFVPADAISSLIFEQLCFRKDASGWKIAGFMGGE